MSSFDALLALFPAEFRLRFGADMRDLFADQLRAARADGRVAVARLWMRTIARMVTVALHEHHDARRHPLHVRSDGMLASVATDLKLAGRALRRAPAFTLVAVLVLSIGSGAVTTIFSAMNALVLRPLPGVAAPNGLVRLERVRRDGSGGTLGASYPYYEQLRGRARTLTGMVAWTKASLTLSTSDAGTAVYGNLVSSDYFATLGVRPALGRFFAGDDRRDAMAEPLVVVSYDFWRTRLGADSGVVGRPMLVNGHTFTLVGVTPPDFAGLDAPIRTDAWVPLAMARQIRPRQDPLALGSDWLRLAGRLAPSATRESAHAELVALGASFEREAREPAFQSGFDDLRISALSGLPSDARGALSGFLGLLLGAATLVLLIASVNVASMLSARAIARRREMAVRSALGAARGRLVRQLLTEILVLFVLGALGGTMLAVAATAALERMPLPRGAGNLTFALELSPDARVLAFALGVSLLVGVAFGLAPALQGARRDVTSRLRDAAPGASGRRTLGGSALVVGQLAMSLLLLVAAGLFLRALDRGRHVAPGFDAGGVSVASFDTESWGYDEAHGRAFYDDLRARIAALPGVSAVSETESLPLAMHSSGDDVRVGSDTIAVSQSNIGADYFAALRLPIVHGRAIDATDGPSAPPVAVVNETFARRAWRDGNALGRTFEAAGERVTVVGIARDAKYATLDERPTPMLYFPIAQRWRSARYVIVRSTTPAAPLAAAVARVVRDIDPALPRPVVTTLRDENAIVLLPQRVAAMVTGALGAVGLLLASVGLYGVVSYAVSRRTREIGIRIAIGARASDVLRMVLRDGLRLAGVGVVTGIALGAAATRLVRSFLFDVSPLDVTTFAATSALLVLVALVATWLPARRAARADPRAALRAE